MPIFHLTVEVEADSYGAAEQCFIDGDFDRLVSVQLKGLPEALAAATEPPEYVDSYPVVWHVYSPTPFGRHLVSTHATREEAAKARSEARVAGSYVLAGPKPRPVLEYHEGCGCAGCLGHLPSEEEGE